MNCHECKHHRNIAGDCHISCAHPLVSDRSGTDLLALLGAMTGRPSPVSEQLGIELNPHGVAKGWAAWPINFDPTWVDACNGFEAILQPKEGAAS